jgi:hypothetical protein
MRFDAFVPFRGRVYAILCQQDKRAHPLEQRRRAKVRTVVVIVIADWWVSGKSEL